MFGQILLSLLLFCISIADAQAKSVNPKYLEKPQVEVVYILASPYSFSEKAATFTISAGEYTGTFEDKKGVYLVGADHCIEMRVVYPVKSNSLVSITSTDKATPTGYVMNFRGGIFLPHEKKSGAALFVFRNSSSQAESQTQGVDGTTTQQIAEQTLPNNPVVAGTGAAMGGLIVNAMIEHGKNNMDFITKQKNDLALRAQLTPKHPN